MFGNANLWVHTEQSPKCLMIIKIRTVIVGALMSSSVHMYCKTHCCLQRAVCGRGLKRLGGDKKAETHSPMPPPPCCRWCPRSCGGPLRSERPSCGWRPSPPSVSLHLGQGENMETAQKASKHHYLCHCHCHHHPHLHSNHDH